MYEEPYGSQKPPTALGQSEGNTEIVKRLETMRLESEANRKTGMNNRDDKWLENLNLYWNRWNFTQKAMWQSKETMPEVPGFVDRFAGAMKDALLSQGTNFYDIIDPADAEGDLTQAVRRLNDVWLSRVGMSPLGIPLDFPAVFEDQTKLGALMMMASTVTWKNDVKGGRVAIDSIDPRNVFLDNTGRNQYRCRRYWIDRNEFDKMSKAKDGKGKGIWNNVDVQMLVTDFAQAQASQNIRTPSMPQVEQEQLQGTGQDVTSQRAPIMMDEYYAKVLDEQGREVYDKSLCVVANSRFLVRGPEPNPYWHECDWLVATPLISSPLSVYGRTYLEDFGAIAKTFNDLTNLILDAVFFSSIRAFAAVPTALMNPEQLVEGIWPGKTFLLEDGMDPKSFAAALEMGNLPAEAMTLWRALKQELAEASGISPVGMGQFAPKGRTTAHEVAQVGQSTMAIQKSIGQTIETRWLDPTLDLVWKTGLQHMKPNDPVLRAAAGEDWADALFQRRRELIKRPITFQARGISRLIGKQAKLRALMQVLQIIGSNPSLMQTFMQEVDIVKFMKYIFALNDVDLSKLTMSQREKQIKQMYQPLQQLQGQAQQGQPNPAGGNAPNAGQIEMQQLAKQLGISNAKSTLNMGKL